MALTIDFTNSNVATNTSVNAISYTTGDGGGASGGLTANVTTINLGNTTVNAVATYSTLAISNATSNSTLASRYLQISASSGQPTVNLVNQNSGVTGRPAINFYAANTTTTTQFFGGINWFASNAAGSFATIASITAQGDSFTSYKADIVAAVNANSNIVLQAGGSASNTLVGNTTGVYLLPNTFTVGTAAYHVSNGNFGIGTSSPGYKLQLSTTGATNTTYLGLTSTSTSSDYGNFILLYNTNATFGNQAGIGIGSGVDGSTTNAYFTIYQANSIGSYQKSLITYNTTNHYWQFLTNGLERMRIDSGGNIGIGTSSPFSATGYGWLTLNGSSGSVYSLLNNGTEAMRLQSDSFANYVNGLANLPLLFYTNNTERMRIEASGNVGIGTTSSYYSLQVLKNQAYSTIIGVYNNNSAWNSAFRAENGTSLMEIGFANPTYGGYQGITANGAYIFSTGSAGMQISTSSGPIQFFNAAGTERMRLDANGNFGIGSIGGDYGREWRLVARKDQNTITNIGVINANTGAAAAANFSKITGTGNSYLDWGLFDGAGSPFDLYQYGAAVGSVIWQFSSIERMRLTYDGKFGLGIVPTVKLHVSANTNGNDGGTFYNSNTGASAQAVLIVQTNGASGLSMGQSYTTKNGFIYLADNSSLTFSTNATSAMTITAGGNVGIANTAPTDKLSVNGTISDAIGSVRSIPVNDQVAAYSLASTDNGKVVSITTGGVTVNGALLTTGFTCAIFNNSASTQTITVGTGATMYLSGSTSANRTLAARGVCSLLMVASNTFVISGSLT